MSTSQVLTKMQILSVYKSMLREAQKMSSYNFRNYALRRIRDSFKDNKTLTDVAKIQEKFQFALKNLETIQRQAVVGHLYSAEKLVIEKQKFQTTK